MLDFGKLLLAIDNLKAAVEPAIRYVQQADAAPRVLAAVSRLVADAMVRELVARPVPAKFVEALEAEVTTILCERLAPTPQRVRALYHAAVQTIGECS